MKDAVLSTVLRRTMRRVLSLRNDGHLTRDSEVALAFFVEVADDLLALISSARSRTSSTTLSIRFGGHAGP